jgi:hypothetical protein
MILAILILWLPDAGGTPAVPANHLTGPTNHSSRLKLRHYCFAIAGLPRKTYF